MPALQRLHVALEAAPVVADQVPAEQGVGLKEESGQKEPAGQAAQEAGALAYVPTGHVDAVKAQEVAFAGL